MLHPLDLLPEFVLGVLPEADAVSVRLHLVDCGACTAEWQAMAGVARLLPLAAEEVRPSAGLRAAIGQRIQNEREASQQAATGVAARGNVTQFRARNRWAWAGAAAASAAALLLVGGALGFALQDSEPDPVVSLQAQAIRAAAGGTLRVARAEAGGLRAAVVQAPSARSAYIQVEGLPQAQAGKAYQAWFSKDGKAFEPSGLFADGRGTWAPAQDELGNYAVMGITLEGAGGSSTPTLPGVIFVDLTQSVALRLR